MFPKDAHFICRKCLTQFFFRIEDLSNIRKIGCPKCNTLSDIPGDIEKFFKFYPRFTSAIEQIKDCNFKLVNYSFEVDHEIRLFWIIELEFKCLACGGHSKFPLKRIEKFADEPGLFVCKKCHIQPKPLKIMKEFFVSFRWVHRSSFRIHDFFWDIISPLQLAPEQYPIQWPIYAKEHQK